MGRSHLIRSSQNSMRGEKKYHSLCVLLGANLVTVLACNGSGFLQVSKLADKASGCLGPKTRVRPLEVVVHLYMCVVST